MNKVFRRLIPFALYWHFALDILLTHMLVIIFLNKGMPLVAAMLMSIDAVFKMALSVPISRSIVKIPPRIRGKVAIALKFTLTIICLTAISQISLKTVSAWAIFLFLLFKILMLIDSLLCAEFIFLLHELFQVSVIQSAAAQNILMRASLAFAPAMALVLLSVQYAYLVVWAMAMAFNFLNTFFLRKLFFLSEQKSMSYHSETPLSFKKLVGNSLMRWGLIYQIVSNLSFAGVALLFLSQLNIHGSVFLNDITVLYSAFLVAQCAALIFGELVVPARNRSHISFILASCGLCLIIAGLSPPGVFRFIICGLIGLTYSFSLSSVQKIVIMPLRGSQFIGYTGWAQTAGRLSSLLSTLILGSLMSMGILPANLLIFCGLFGMFTILSIEYLR